MLIRDGSINDKLNQAKRIALQQLRSLNAAGLAALPTPKSEIDFELLASDGVIDAGSRTAESIQTAANETKRPRPASGSTPSRTQESKPNYLVEPNPESYETSLMDLSERTSKLSILQAKISSCEKCDELANCRSNTVFGVGNPQPELCFLGEGPGADEDRLGEPFVGAAGELLNKIIEACKMKREEVYILNTVKCRPPGNRNPSETELENCWPYAIQQLEILQPKFICCLGSVAAKTLLQTKQSIGRMRGQFFKFRGSRVIVTYHPAYLLRNPAAKRQVWDDMKMLLAQMGRPM